MSCVGWFYCICILLWLNGGFAYYLAAEGGKGMFIMVRMMYIAEIHIWESNSENCFISLRLIDHMFIYRPLTETSSYPAYVRSNVVNHQGSRHFEPVSSHFRTSAVERGFICVQEESWP